jgi:methylmalonyl-CoA mutase
VPETGSEINLHLAIHLSFLIFDIIKTEDLINSIMTRDLFEDFSPANKDAWINQAIKDLKGKDFSKSLGSKLWGDLDIAPFYTKEDLIGLPKLPEESFEDAHEIQGFPSRNWANFSPVFPQTSNHDVLNALENGASGLLIHLQGNENLSELLKDVKPEYISILIKPLADPMFALNTFLTWVKNIGVDESQLNGGLLWSPMDMLFEDGKSLDETILVLNQILNAFPKSSNFRAFHFNFSRYAEAGATGLDELIFGFGEMVELIDQSGINPKEIFERSGIFTAIGDMHFPEIAKLKTIRFFTSELALQYEIELRPQEIFIFAKTSEWSKSTMDANTNLIRQTYEAMAAVLGGANGIWVAPIQQQNSTELELRIARNVSSVLVHESYLDKVADPTAGSYYLDFLVNLLMEKTKAGLQVLEEKGGWRLGFELNEIQQNIRKSRLDQQNQIFSGQASKIGVNKYPASQKLKSDLEFTPLEEEPKDLRPSRASYLVELQNQTQL